MPKPEATATLCVTFVLPGNNYSGGVRVTVDMAKELMTRGHKIRIAYPKAIRFTKQWLREQFFGFINKAHLSSAQETAGWVDSFKGEVAIYGRLQKLSFQLREIVIAVGTYTIREVFDLNADVVKLRYNHGLPTEIRGDEKALWRLPMPTITVNNKLVFELEHRYGQKVLAVIPNGIDLSEYHFMDGVKRCAVGTIYSSHLAKAPDRVISILQRLAAQRHDIPQIVFGTDQRPPGLRHVEYYRSPSIAKAREIYNRCLVWVVASQSEGFSLPLLEAMACGCAVVSSNTHGAQEIIRHSKNGVLVVKVQVEEFLYAIQQLLDNQAMRAALSKEGKRTAELYTWKTAGDKMEYLLLELVASEQRKT